MSKFKNKKSLSYKKDVINREGIRETLWDNKAIEQDFTKMYHTCLARIYALNGLPTKLFLYLTSVMDERGEVVNDRTTKTRFLEEMEERGQSFSYSGLDRAYKEIESTGLITRTTRGRYKVNPEFIWKNTEKSREETIRLTLEFNYRIKAKAKVERIPNADSGSL